MPDNRDEIVRLAVELANMVRTDGLTGNEVARRILALTSPPEPEKPKRWPGIDAEPSTVHDELRRGLLVLCDNGECHIRGPIRNTPAEAVAAWNEMIDRITGTDNNVIAMARDTIKCDDNCPACKKMWQEWLAERTGGSAADAIERGSGG